jgi:hypothetical protein
MTSCAVENITEVTVTEDVTNISTDESTAVEISEQVTVVQVDSSLTNIELEQKVTQIIIDKFTLEGTVVQPENSLLILNGTTCFTDTSLVKMDGDTQIKNALLTGDLDAGGNKLTNVGDATARDCAPNAGQIQDSSIINMTDIGVADAYVANPDIPIDAYRPGQVFHVLIGSGNTNTGTAATLNISGKGAIPIKKEVSFDPHPGDIKENKYSSFVYDGTNMQIFNPVHQDIDIKLVEDLAFNSTRSGVIEVPNQNAFDLMIPDVGANTFTTKAGTGWICRPNIVTGVNDIIKVSWVEQVTDIGATVPVQDGNVPVAIDQNGDVVFRFNNNFSLLSREDDIDFIQIGTITVSGGQVTRIFPGFNVPMVGQYNYYQLMKHLGAFAAAAEGPRMEPVPGTLRFSGSGGPVTSPLGGVQTDIRFPDAPKLVPEPLIPIYVSVSSGTGAFSFDLSGELDPNNYEASTGFIDIVDIGGGLVRVQSDIALRPNTGDTVTLYNSSVPGYDGSYLVVNQIGSNRFDITSPFLGTSTGNWRATTAVTAGSFTNIRLFYLTNLIIGYRGVKQYANLADARLGFASEIFVEALVTGKNDFLGELQTSYHEKTANTYLAQAMKKDGFSENRAYKFTMRIKNTDGINFINIGVNPEDEIIICSTHEEVWDFALQGVPAVHECYVENCKKMGITEVEDS